MLFLLFARYVKSRYRRFSREGQLVFRVQILLTVVSVAQIAACLGLSTFTYPYASAVIRPLTIICEVPRLRSYIYNFGRLIFDTRVFIIFVVGWLIIWASVF